MPSHGLAWLLNRRTRPMLSTGCLVRRSDLAAYRVVVAQGGRTRERLRLPFAHQIRRHDTAAAARVRTLIQTMITFGFQASARSRPLRHLLSCRLESAASTPASTAVNRSTGQLHLPRTHTRHSSWQNLAISQQVGKVVCRRRRNWCLATCRRSTNPPAACKYASV